MSTERHPQMPPRRKRKRRWLVIALLGMAVLAVVLIPDTGSSQDKGPRLTHTVQRGDLIVTIVEQGTLESAENTEIKCKVRTASVPITWVIESGSEVKPGDVLVRLATLDYEDRLTEVSKWVYSSQSGLARSSANTKRAQLAVSEYLEGRYRTQLMTLQKDLAIAESNLRTAQNMLGHAETMAQRGYVSALDLERSGFAVTQAELNVGVKQKEITVLTDYTKAMELETLKGDLAAGKARHEANKSQAKNAEVQLMLCQGDLANCVVRAEKSGTVIYPTGQPWERVPEIEEGTNIYMGQTMLLMPDLSQMQVKLGIREAYIERMSTGLKARVALPNRTLHGEVDSVASVAKPAAWWNGNTVRYDTVVKLPSIPGLMPGMSAEVEVIVAEHRDVLTVPVAALVECAQGAFCWVKTAEGAEKRSLELGDTNDRFTVVKEGLQQGDKVVLNPFAFAEAKSLAQQAGDESDVQDPNALKSPKKTEIDKTLPSKFDAKVKASGSKSTESFKNADKKQSLSKPENFKPVKK
jgi:HlyD family secretion protein